MRTDFFNNLDIFGNRTPEEKARDLGRSIWRIFGDEEYTDPASKWSEVNQRDIKSLLNDGADADYQENGKSILDNIIGGIPKLLTSSYPAIEMVVDKVKDINQVSGGSALINILKKHEAVTSFVYIIDKKRYGIDLKHYASLIDSVINKNPDLDVQDSQDKNTALMLAIINGQEDVARKILDKNPNLDLQNSDGNTALMLCFIHRRFDLAKTILEKKPDVRPVNDKKESALLLALKYQKQDMAVEILERGADPRVNSNEGDALHFANSEVMRRRLRGKIIEFEKAETPPNPDMIVLTTKVDTVITLTEIFNFKKMECTSFIQKENELPGAPSRETFEAIQNTPSLQEAFALHKKLGGTMDVDKFFPQRKISVPLNIPSN